MLSRKKSIRLEIRISEEDKDRLLKMTKAMETSEGDIIREALKEYFERKYEE